MGPSTIQGDAQHDFSADGNLAHSLEYLYDGRMVRPSPVHEPAALAGRGG